MSLLSLKVNKGIIENGFETFEERERELNKE